MKDENRTEKKTPQGEVQNNQHGGKKSGHKKMQTKRQKNQKRLMKIQKRK